MPLRVGKDPPQQLPTHDQGQRGALATQHPGATWLDQLFDSLAIRVDGPRSWDADITVRWNIKGKDPVTLSLRNGVLTHTAGKGPATPAPHAEVTLEESDLRALLLGTITSTDLRARPGTHFTGDPAVLGELLGCLSSPDPDFAIVTP